MASCKRRNPSPAFASSYPEKQAELAGRALNFSRASPLYKAAGPSFLKIVFRISATLVYVPTGVEPRLYHI